MRWAGGWCVALLLAAPLAQGAGGDPLQLMRELEVRVLAARHVIIEADVRASGALSAHLTGRTEFLERNRAHAQYAGDLQGRAASLEYSSDGRSGEIRNGDAKWAEGLGSESNHAGLVGVLRLGLWHNLSRMSVLQGPEHAGGGIEAWSMPDGFRPTTYALGGEFPGAMSFGYDLMLDGRNAGNVRLWLDPVSGLPRRRQMTLKLPQGEATVVEDYTRFTLE